MRKQTRIVLQSKSEKRGHVWRAGYNPRVVEERDCLSREEEEAAAAWRRSPFSW